MVWRRVVSVLKALNIPLEKEKILNMFMGQSCVYSLTVSKIPVVTSVKIKWTIVLLFIGA
jgi:hypothetical protein